MPRPASLRRFKKFFYATVNSWSRARCVIGKAEHLAKGPNPRFIVTSLPPSAIDGQTLYERVYCARGEMENRIKEQQLDLLADCTPPPPCAPTNSGCGSRRSPTCCSRPCAAIGLRHTQSRMPPAARSH